MEPIHSHQKPEAVEKAVKLLWASLVIGVLKVAIDYVHLSNLAPSLFTNIILVFVFGLMAFLISKISAGCNWARVVFLILFLIGALPALGTTLDEFTRSAVLGALSVVQIVTQVIAMYLVFTSPGKEWFKKTSRPEGMAA